MNRRPKWSAFAVCLSATGLSFVALVAITFLIGLLTDSGPLGICGPFGPAGNFLMGLLFCSVPLSVVVGAYAARRSYRHFTREEKKA